MPLKDVKKCENAKYKCNFSTDSNQIYMQAISRISM